MAIVSRSMRRIPGGARACLFYISEQATLTDASTLASFISTQAGPSDSAANQDPAIRSDPTFSFYQCLGKQLALLSVIKTNMSYLPANQENLDGKPAPSRTLTSCTGSLRWRRLHDSCDKGSSAPMSHTVHRCIE